VVNEQMKSVQEKNEGREIKKQCVPTHHSKKISFLFVTWILKVLVSVV